MSRFERLFSYVFKGFYEILFILDFFRFAPYDFLEWYRMWYFSNGIDRQTHKEADRKPWRWAAWRRQWALSGGGPKSKGFRSGENPVTAIKDAQALPKVKSRPKHHKAMRWQDVPDFYADLRTRNAMAAMALMFT